MPKESNTYRDEIQALQRQLWSIYERFGVLRDYATGEEKEAWNTARSRVYEVVYPLEQLDNSLLDDRAKMQVTPAKKESDY